MRESKSIDFAKLLGFETVYDRMSGGVDFQDETVGAKLGAKVGAGLEGPAGTVDYARLLGFETVGEHISGGVDFQEDTIGAKLGAKVGGGETGAPAARPCRDGCCRE